MIVSLTAGASIADHRSPAHASERSALADGEVLVWQLDLESPERPLDHLFQLLSVEERERAGRYVFERDRNRFIAARGMLRTILAGYVDADAADICFKYNAHGKPFLTGSGDLTFNLSHSHRQGLLAVCRGRQIGVDIEWIRPGIDILGIARSTFSTGEQERLASLPVHEQLAGFYACWTRKEAYIKARGEGLSYPLDAFDVSLAPGEPPAILWSAEGIAEIERWSFHSIDVPPGYAAALAVEAPCGDVRIAMSG